MLLSYPGVNKVEIPMIGPYDWYDIALIYPKVKTIEGLHRALAKRSETPINLETVRTDFKAIRQYWRDRIEDKSYMKWAKLAFISPRDIEKFMTIQRKKLVTSKSNRSKE